MVKLIREKLGDIEEIQPIRTVLTRAIKPTRGDVVAFPSRDIDPYGPARDRSPR
jgi:hypothetical protein